MGWVLSCRVVLPRWGQSVQGDRMILPGVGYQKYLTLLEGTFHQTGSDIIPYPQPSTGETWHQIYLTSLPRRNMGPERKWHHSLAPPIFEQINRHLWKHYLPATSLAGGNNGKLIGFMKRGQMTTNRNNSLKLINMSQVSGTSFSVHWWGHHILSGILWLI